MIRSRAWRLPVVGLIAVWLAMAVWQSFKSVPPGLRASSPPTAVPADSITLIPDVTAADAYGRPIASHAIFSSVLELIAEARELLVLDLYRFDSVELRNALIERHRTLPALKVLLITDPVNDLYGSRPSFELRLLAAAGIDVVRVDTRRLRSPNPVYSGFYTLALRWWLRADPESGFDVPLPGDEAPRRASLAAWARLMNRQADQRSVVIGDDGHGGLVGLVGSLDPQEASRPDSNVAVRVQDSGVLEPLLESELSTARFSGWSGTLELPRRPAASAAAASASAQALTEGSIREALLTHMAATRRGDRIDIAMDRLAERSIIEALLDAARRGVSVRLMLDPNRESFGQARSGLPNQPVAAELVSASDGAIHVRWYRTHGERFHPKLVMIADSHSLWLTLGSASLTRPTLDDYNLAANVALETPLEAAVAVQAQDYFETLWANRAGLGIEYTADFAAYADADQSHYWLYRLLEATGLAGF